MINPYKPFRVHGQSEQTQIKWCLIMSFSVGLQNVLKFGKKLNWKWAHPTDKVRIVHSA